MRAPGTEESDVGMDKHMVEFSEEQILALVRRSYLEGDASFDIVPGKCALLVIDMQDEFVRPAWTPYWVPEAARLGLARLERRHQFIHAFPSVSNAASNAICLKLRFSLMEECQFEYPHGNLLRVNDWSLDLFDTGLTG